ncbi:MAG: hypothetical protein MRZ79_10300 [Bacteroidia bacterium]|nr:hypothetical protein [Bacteroidia bacterium]
MKKLKLNVKEVLLLGLTLGVALALGIAFFSAEGVVQALDAVDTSRAVSVLP